MPAYQYHLKLELYSCPAATSDRELSSGPSVYFLPPAGTDIFTTKLPAHTITKRTANDRIRRSPHPASRSSSRDPVASRPSSAGLTEAFGNVLLLPERNTALKEPVSPALPLTKPSPVAAAKDWRFGSVSIDSIDMENKEKDAASAKPTAGVHTRALYVPSDTKTTDVGWGVVRLYRDTQETPSPVSYTHLTLPTKRIV